MTNLNRNTHSDGHVCSKCGGKGYISKTETNEQGYTYEYLRVCDCQREQQKPMLKASANIPYEYRNCSINDFNIAVYTNKEMAKTVKNAAAGFISNYMAFKAKGKGLYLYSRAKGSGKTRMACSIGNAIIQTQAEKVSFVKTLELLSMIRDTYRKDSETSERDILTRVKTTPVLILDDIGAENPKDWVCGVFLEILDYRISNRLITFFTSNLRQDALKLDERIIDRICKMSIELHFPEESIRRREAGNECADLMGLLGI